MEEWGLDFKVKQYGNTMATTATIPSLAEKTEGLLTESINRVCSNGRSRKNKCSDDILKSAGRIYASMGPICHGGR